MQSLCSNIIQLVYTVSVHLTNYKDTSRTSRLEVRRFDDYIKLIAKPNLVEPFCVS